MKDLPKRPAMGAVIVPEAIYDEAKRRGLDLTGFLRAEACPMIEHGVIEGLRFVEGEGPNRQARRKDEREKAAARKKLGKWAKRGGK